jgi:ubiquitin carboxyl-terminal hydrolase 20/33
MHALWSKNDTNTTIAPCDLVQAVKLVNPMFRGYLQQDSQEFLLCLLDQLHEELKRVQISNNNDINTIDSGNNLNGVVDDDINMNISSQSDTDSFKSCGSTPTSENNFLSNYETNVNGDGPTILFSNERIQRSQSNASDNLDSGCYSTTSTLINSTKSENELILNPKNLDKSTKNQTKKKKNNIIIDDDEDDVDEKKGDDLVEKKEKNVNKKDKKVYTSVISDIFDGKMIGQVQCIGCESISNTIETFQDLSLPIPNKEYIQVSKVK